MANNWAILHSCHFLLSFGNLSLAHSSLWGLSAIKAGTRSMWSYQVHPLLCEEAVIISY